MTLTRNRDGTSNSALMATCLALNGSGFRVFPVGSMAKKPVIKGWNADLRPYTRAEILRWPWRRAAGLGWLIPRQVVVIDVDVKGHYQGREHLAVLESALGVLPVTARQETLSGGWHLIFEVPECVGDMWNKVPLLDVGFADIDVLRPGKNYMAIYDAEVLEQERAPLPDAWLDHITKVLGPRRWLHQGFRPTKGSADPVRRIAEAKEGDRNNTLFNVVVREVSTGGWSGDLEAACIGAAIQRGLDEDGVGATVISAVNTGTRNRARCLGWAEGVITDLKARKRRNRLALSHAALVIAEVAAGVGPVFGLSCRDLGERLGMSHRAAADYLQGLCRDGHLKRREVGESGRAALYELVDQPASDGDTQHLTTYTLIYERGDGELSPFDASGQVRSIVDHEAFMRPGGGTSMPKTCGLVMAALLDGPLRPRDLRQRTHLSRSTVSRGLRTLEDAGLVAYDREGTGQAILNHTDPMKALDKWAEWSGSAGSHERQRMLHQAQREAFAARASNEDTKSGIGPSTAENQGESDET